MWCELASCFKASEQPGEVNHLATAYIAVESDLQIERVPSRLADEEAIPVANSR